MYCEICGKPIDDDDDNVTDTDGMGYVHDKCLSEWRDDSRLSSGGTDRETSTPAHVRKLARRSP